MPRKETRNYSGSIFRREVKKDGKTITVFDARKRFTTLSGENKEKFKRCRSKSEAQTALINFQNEIDSELKTIRLNDDELIDLFIGIREKRIEFSEFKKVIKAL